MQLHKDKHEFEKRSIKVVVICPEKLNNIHKFLSSEFLDLEFVSDPKHILANKYNQQVKILKLGRLPAQIILDKNGKKVFEHFANSMRDIVENHKIFDIVDK